MKMYTTSDLNLASCLLTAGEKIFDSEKDGNKVIWHLQDTDTLRKTVNDYFNDKLCLNVRNLFYQQNLLKTQINAQRYGGR